MKYLSIILLSVALTGCGESIHDFAQNQDQAVMKSEGLAAPSPRGGFHCAMLECLNPLNYVDIDGEGANITM